MAELGREGLIVSRPGAGTFVSQAHRSSRAEPADYSWQTVTLADRVIDNGKMLRTFIQIVRSGAVGRKSLGTRPKRLVQRWLVDGLNLPVEWRLLDIWNDMYLFGQWVFGTPLDYIRPHNQPQPAYWKATLVMVGVCVGCALYLRKRVRAVEVVA